MYLEPTDEIAITCDIDWAPEAIIEDTLRIFEDYQVKCTLFATHQSEALNNCNRDLFEIAIHPNFNPLLEGRSQASASEVLGEILELYPEATGVRSHSMTQNSTLLQLFADRGLRYDANHFLPYHTHVRPYKLWTGMIRLPYIWEDDIHWAYGRDFEDLGINLDQKGLKIFDFHPIHIFLNTENQARYLGAKPYYQEPEDLKNFINPGSGARTALIKLCEQLAKNDRYQPKKLREMVPH